MKRQFQAVKDWKTTNESKTCFDFQKIPESILVKSDFGDVIISENYFIITKR